MRTAGVGEGAVLTGALEVVAREAVLGASASDRQLTAARQNERRVQRIARQRLPVRVGGAKEYGVLCTRLNKPVLAAGKASRLEGSPHDAI